MLALLPAMEHAPNQRHTIEVLNDGDSEFGHVDSSKMGIRILSQPSVLSNSAAMAKLFFLPRHLMFCDFRGAAARWARAVRGKKEGKV
jgi:hypothetical protein